MKKKIKKQKITWEKLTIAEKIGAIIIELLIIFIIFILPFILCSLLYNILGGINYE